MHRLLTGEENTAVDGLFRAGATEVTANDGHGAGCSFELEELDPRMQIVHGPDLPTWLPLLDGKRDATALIGAHALASSPPGASACQRSTSQAIPGPARRSGDPYRGS